MGVLSSLFPASLVQRELFSGTREARCPERVVWWDPRVCQPPELQTLAWADHEDVLVAFVLVYSASRVQFWSGLGPAMCRKGKPCLFHCARLGLASVCVWFGCSWREDQVGIYPFLSRSASSHHQRDHRGVGGEQWEVPNSSCSSLP